MIFLIAMYVIIRRSQTLLKILIGNWKKDFEYVIRTRECNTGILWWLRWNAGLQSKKDS